MRSTLNPKLLDAVAVSRFALTAGEGARVPTTNRLVPDWIDFLGKAGSWQQQLTSFVKLSFSDSIKPIDGVSFLEYSYPSSPEQ